MTATRPADPETAAPARRGLVEQHRRLPRLAFPALFVLGVLAGAALSAATGFSIVLAAVYGVVLGTVAVYAVSRGVEGSRKSFDRWYRWSGRSSAAA
jgi:phosphate transport system permease protein